MPSYGWSVESTACVSPAEPLASGTFWNSMPGVSALVTSDIVSPGPTTASVKGTDPITVPALKLTPPLVDV